MRRLIIGDIHSCLTELLSLIDKAKIGPQDEIIALGDLVDRGPDPAGVLKFFQETPNARSIMGNHERKNIAFLEGRVRPALSQRITRFQLGEQAYKEACAWMRTLPHSIELPEALLVHGFFEPGLSIQEQQDTVIVGTLTGEKRISKLSTTEPWYKLYDGNKPLIVGHRLYHSDGQPLIHRDKNGKARVFGLDTGVYKGKFLTGLLLPDFEIIQVPSAKNYWEETRNQYGQQNPEGSCTTQLSWSEARTLLDQWKEPVSRGNKAAQLQSQEIERFLETGERALERLLAKTLADCEKILQKLADTNYQALPADQQGRAFSKVMGRTPLRNLLQQARKGSLDKASLIKQYPSPTSLLRFLERNGLQESSQIQER